MDGYSVLTKTCQYTPRVLGPWIGSSAKFDPEKHKVTLDITLSSEMREEMCIRDRLHPEYGSR